MNRFYGLSILLHLVIFSIILQASQGGSKKIPLPSVYKVSLAPLPQPRIMNIEELQKEEVKKESKEEKTAPKKESGTKKEKIGEKTKKIKKGLPDISPKIITGSGRGFTYSYYLNILLNKIGEQWQNPYKGQDVVLKSIIYFEIDKNGTIANVRLEENSGDDLYNETTIRAVTLTKKLPPLPEEFSNDYLKVHLEFLTGQ